MAFQSTVRTDQASGVIGEVAFDGPLRVRPKDIDPSSTVAVANTIGKAFTSIPGEQGAVIPGGDLTTTDINFVGILMQPKEHALVGTGSSSLLPTLDLADGVIGSFCYLGIIYVAMATSGVAGDPIFYTDATGILAVGTASTNESQIPNCVLYEDCDGNGLAIIELTN